jgi:hypothetical protein
MVEAAAANDRETVSRLLGALDGSVNEVEVTELPKSVRRRTGKCSVLDVAVGAGSDDVVTILLDAGAATPTCETLKMAVSANKGGLIKLIWERVPAEDRPSLQDLVEVAIDFNAGEAMAWIMKETTTREERTSIISYAVSRGPTAMLCVLPFIPVEGWWTRAGDVPSMLGIESVGLCWDGGLTGILLGGPDAVRSIVFPSHVTKIGTGAFDGSTALESVVLPAGCQDIGARAFYGCTSLGSIAIPSSMRTIGEYAFCGCTSLVEVALSEGLTEIGMAAFWDCSSMLTIRLPSTLKLDTRAVWGSGSSIDSREARRVGQARGGGSTPAGVRAQAGKGGAADPSHAAFHALLTERLSPWVISEQGKMARAHTLSVLHTLTVSIPARMRRIQGRIVGVLRSLSGAMTEMFRSGGLLEQFGDFALHCFTSAGESPRGPQNGEVAGSGEALKALHSFLNALGGLDEHLRFTHTYLEVAAVISDVLCLSRFIARPKELAEQLNEQASELPRLPKLFARGASPTAIAGLLAWLKGQPKECRRTEIRELLVTVSRAAVDREARECAPGDAVVEAISAVYKAVASVSGEAVLTHLGQANTALFALKTTGDVIWNLLRANPRVTGLRGGEHTWSDMQRVLRVFPDVVLAVFQRTDVCVQLREFRKEVENLPRALAGILSFDCDGLSSACTAVEEQLASSVASAVSALAPLVFLSPPSSSSGSGSRKCAAAITAGGNPSAVSDKVLRLFDGDAVEMRRLHPGSAIHEQRDDVLKTFAEFWEWFVKAGAEDRIVINHGLNGEPPSVAIADAFGHLFKEGIPPLGVALIFLGAMRRAKREGKPHFGALFLCFAKAIADASVREALAALDVELLSDWFGILTGAGENAEGSLAMPEWDDAAQCFRVAHSDPLARMCDVEVLGALSGDISIEDAVALANVDGTTASRATMLGNETFLSLRARDVMPREGSPLALLRPDSWYVEVCGMAVCPIFKSLDGGRRTFLMTEDRLGAFERDMWSSTMSGMRISGTRSAASKQPSVEIDSRDATAVGTPDAGCKRGEISPVFLFIKAAISAGLSPSAAVQMWQFGQTVDLDRRTVARFAAFKSKHGIVLRSPAAAAFSRLLSERLPSGRLALDHLDEAIVALKSGKPAKIDGGSDTAETGRGVRPATVESGDVAAEIGGRDDAAKVGCGAAAATAEDGFRQVKFEGGGGAAKVGVGEGPARLEGDREAAIIEGLSSGRPS